jgi:hypothetical protein
VTPFDSECTFDQIRLFSSAFVVRQRCPWEYPTCYIGLDLISCEIFARHLSSHAAYIEFGRSEAGGHNKWPIPWRLIGMAAAFECRNASVAAYAAGRQEMARRGMSEGEQEDRDVFSDER